MLSEVIRENVMLVDATFTFIKENEFFSVQETMNSFHEDIKFTYETESDNTIAFFAVYIIRKTDRSLDTAVYRKKTNYSI